MHFSDHPITKLQKTTTEFNLPPGEISGWVTRWEAKIDIHINEDIHSILMDILDSEEPC